MSEQVAWCPQNPEHHKEFITCAHVMQDWRVDECGNWIETIDPSVQTSFGPDIGNEWTCASCAAVAVKEDPRK